MLSRPVSACLLALALFSTSPAQVSTPPQVRTFLDLEAYASQLAQKPYVAPQAKLDPFFEGLKYDGHREIRFSPDKALYRDQGDSFHAEFFHPGWMFKKTVTFAEIVDGQPKPVPFNKDLFDYGKLELPGQVRRIRRATAASACWPRNRSPESASSFSSSRARAISAP